MTFFTIQNNFFIPSVYTCDAKKQNDKNRQIHTTLTLISCVTHILSIFDKFQVVSNFQSCRNTETVKMWIIFSLLIAIGFLIHKWATKNYNYFKVRNIAHGKPKLFFGTGKELLMQRLSLPEYVQMWYNEFPTEK